MIHKRNNVVGTCVVILMAQDEIVVGVDSLSRCGDAHSQVCKIVRVKDIFFVNAGFSEQRDVGFSIRETAIQAIGGATNIKDALNRLEHSVDEGIKNCFSSLDCEGKESLLSCLSKHPVDIACFGFEERRSMLSTIKFTLKFQSDEPEFEIETKNHITSDANDIITHLMGSYGAIIWYIGLQPEKWKDGLITFVRNAIQTEIDYHNKSPMEERYVGPPIIIIRVTPQGFLWIQDELGCG